MIRVTWLALAGWHSLVYLTFAQNTVYDRLFLILCTNIGEVQLDVRWTDAANGRYAENSCERCRGRGRSRSHSRRCRAACESGEKRLRLALFTGSRPYTSVACGKMLPLSPSAN